MRFSARLLATLGDELGVAGRQVMEILMGIFESGAYGRRVEVPQKDCNYPLLRWREQAGLALPGAIPRHYGSGSKPKTAASAEFH